jgi:Holliday junction resolvase RusA-like endonuclease
MTRNEAMTSLFLPFPPSTNALFKNRKGGRAKTKKYQTWLVEAFEALLKQQAYKRDHVDKVAVSVFLKAPTAHRRDADNCLKAICDFLVTHGIIKGDDSRYMRRVSAEWKDEMPVGCYVNIIDITECPTRFADLPPSAGVTAKRRGK